MDSNSKSAYMKDHGCRFCLCYNTCSHESCRYDGTRLINYKPKSPKKDNKEKKPEE